MKFSLSGNVIKTSVQIVLSKMQQHVTIIPSVMPMNPVIVEIVMQKIIIVAYQILELNYRVLQILSLLMIPISHFSVIVQKF